MIPRSLQPIWQYRGFIAGNLRREFQAKYRNSLLGAAWTVINPLAMIAVYTLVFSQVMPARLPGSEGGFSYSIFLCAGILPWGLFAEVTARAQNTFLENANLLKKLNFPRLCLPIIIVAGALINFAVIFAIFLLFLIVTGNFPGLVIVSLIPVYAILVLFAIGLGIALGVLNVFFRDIGHLFAVVLQFWFWFTPIVYPVSVVPATFGQAIAWNPITPLMLASQRVLVHGEWPHPEILWYPGLLAGLVCATALWLFRRRAAEMVDEL